MTTPVGDGCFMRNLVALLDKRSYLNLTGRLTIEIGILILIPIIALLIAKHLPDSWDAPGQHVIVGLLKIGSITLLGFHAVGFAPQIPSKAIGCLMVLTAVLYVVYLIQGASDCTSGKFICAFPHYRYTTIVINLVAFVYMFLFAFFGAYSIKTIGQTHLGQRLFNEAFVFGVNLPSIIAFVLVVGMYAFNLVDHPDLFFDGAMALLIFVSTAATICIDHFAQPLWSAGPGCAKA